MVAPAAIRVEGGSFGFQAGAGETDTFLLVMNKSGADKLMKSEFKLGGEAAAMAGPVGRTAQAETDALMRAEMLGWSRSRGVFAGFSLEGCTLDKRTITAPLRTRPDKRADRQGRSEGAGGRIRPAGCFEELFVPGEEGTVRVRTVNQLRGCPAAARSASLTLISAQTDSPRLKPAPSDCDGRGPDPA